MTITSVGSQRCSAWARAAELSPAGTAGHYRGFLLLELPLPWPRDVSEIPDVAALSDVLAGRGLRVQAVIPGASQRRATLYSSVPADGFFAGMAARTAEIEGGDLRACVTELLAGGGGGGEPVLPGTRDLLVCTHGRRDVCCGSLGTVLAREIGDVGSLPAGVRTGRTSHTGGHRFAPTFIVLPEATMWAFADAALVAQVLARSGAAADVADRYRGCSGLGGPRVQTLERSVLAEVGWSLLDGRRRGTELPDGRVRLEVAGDNGSTEAWEAAVTAGRTMPVPDCGHPIEEAKKSETEWEVVGLTRV